MIKLNGKSIITIVMHNNIKVMMIKMVEARKSFLLKFVSAK